MLSVLGGGRCEQDMFPTACGAEPASRHARQRHQRRSSAVATTSKSATERAGGTADIHDDGDTVRRSVTIRRPLLEVQNAWRAAGIDGRVSFSEAPGDL